MKGEAGKHPGKHLSSPAPHAPVVTEVVGPLPVGYTACSSLFYSLDTFTNVPLVKSETLHYL